MEPVYNYISSTDYINNLAFDHIETYSFQRGEDFKESPVLIKPEYEGLKVRKDKQNNLTPPEEDRFLQLHRFLGYTQYLINDNGQLHPSAKKISSFKFDDPAVVKLIHILRTEIREIPSWLCAPVYRDAIIFYDKENNILSTLNICLSCQYMETKMFNHINGDFETYDLLKRFFIDIGHNVEEPTKFISDELNKLKGK